MNLQKKGPAHATRSTVVYVYRRSSRPLRRRRQPAGWLATLLNHPHVTFDLGTNPGRRVGDYLRVAGGDVLRWCRSCWLRTMKLIGEAGAPAVRPLLQEHSNEFALHH